MYTVEMRCPVGPKRLLSKMLLDGEQPHIVDGNLIEISCSDCKRSCRRDLGDDVVRVLHRFNLVGYLVETVVVRTGE